jgi:hypothetical protein
VDELKTVIERHGTGMSAAIGHVPYNWEILQAGDYMFFARRNNRLDAHGESNGGGKGAESLY